MTLQTERLRTVEQIRGFLDGNGEVGFTPLDRDEAYGFMRRTLVRLDYDALGRAGKGTVREFLGKATGLSRAQVTRLIGQYRTTGRVEDRRAANSGRSFQRVYTAADIRLLAVADEIGGQLCGPAACEVLRRQYEVFGDTRFERLSRLSPSHLYNLRRSKTYRARRTTVEHTRPTTVRIGERRRPDPGGKPGYVRVDTVHQGDRNGVKGVYDINLIDEVTQFEHVGAVAGIAETFLVPVLQEMLVSLPFVVLGFHADNGSEYVNRQVAAMLNKLHVPDFTKSRARRSNDNALVEGKNASVVRKWLGHDHIPQRFAPQVNAFARDVLSPYLNFHHPCLFATEVRDAKGKVRRRYRRQDVATPYEKLKSLPNAERFLKPGVTFADLDVVPTRCPISRRTAARTGRGTSCSAPSAAPFPRPRERTGHRAGSIRRGPAPGPPPSPGGRDRPSAMSVPESERQRPAVASDQAAATADPCPSG